MSLDISALRAKLNQLSNKARREDVLWKPQEGENVVRIVPLASNPTNPFTELYFHYLGKNTYLSPLSFGERDPINEFAQQLRSEGQLSKEEWAKTKDFIPKMRTFVPVVVRGKESEGVRFWAFGKTVYLEILGVINDPDYGDITDPESGRDIKVTFVPQEKSPTGFAQTTIRVSPKITTVTSDKELKQKLLTEQPDLFSVYERLSYEQLQGILEQWLDPKKGASQAPVTVKNEATKATTDEWADAVDASAVVTTEPVEEAPAKPSSKKKAIEDFDSIFNS